MKTVGERIRQARLYRGWSGMELATKVGYKTQSGIANLENRSITAGGHKLPAIAKALDVSLGWLLNGPDVDDVGIVPKFDETSGIKMAPVTASIAKYEKQESTAITASDNSKDNLYRAQKLLSELSSEGLEKAIEFLEMFAQRYPFRASISAGVSVPAQKAA